MIRFSFSAAVLLVCTTACRDKSADRKSTAPALTGKVESLRIAAASDLAISWKDLGERYEKQSGVHITLSFGSTGLLAKQIAEGAPFDVFAAAKASFVDELIAKGACAADSKALYGRGRIALWVKTAPAPTSVAALVASQYLKIAIANPAHAPYGQAAMEAFERSSVLPQLQPRLVFGENVRQTLQFAESGNADVAVVALSLAVVSNGAYSVVPEALYAPINQALVVCGHDGARLTAARSFAAFVNSPEGRTVMKRYGFLLPSEQPLPRTE